MASTSDCREIFNERVNNLINSHLLLADKAISVLLRCVASTPEFTAVVSKTLERVSYVEEFERSRVFYFKDAKTHLRFVLPNDKNRIFTLVVCLLSEMDAGRRNLLQFLHEYFPNPDGDDFLAFQRFAQTILVPFAKAGDSILKGLETTVSFGAKPVATEGEANPSTTQPPTKPLQSKPVVMDVYKKLVFELEAFCFKVENDASVSLLQKNECLTLAGALHDAIIDKNTKLIHQLWIGFNNTLIVNNVNNDSCVKIQNLLEEAELC